MEGRPALVPSVEVVVGDLVKVGDVVGDAGLLELPEDIGDVLDGVVCYQFSMSPGALVDRFPRWKGRSKAIQEKENSRIIFDWRSRHVT